MHDPRPNSGHERRGCVLGLRIPADPARSVTLSVLRLTASELSKAIGGGPLEDTLTAEQDGGAYAFFCDEHRVAKGLSPMPRTRRGSWRRSGT